MSRALPKDERQPLDDYPTPQWCVDRLLEGIGDFLAYTLTREPQDGTRRWKALEPFSGSGAICQAFDRWVDNRDRQNLIRPTWYSYEPQTAIVPNWMNWMGADALASERLNEYRVIVTNPSFQLAYEFAKRARLQAPKSWLIMLVRLNWLAGEERREWLESNTPDIYVLPNRPSFTGAGTDATDYAWAVWPPTPEGESDHVPGIHILKNTPAAIRNAEKKSRTKKPVNPQSKAILELRKAWKRHPEMTLMQILCAGSAQEPESLFHIPAEQWSKLMKELV